MASLTTTQQDRKIACKPFGSTLLDNLSLLSPRTWIGIAQMRQIDISWSTLLPSVLCLVVPAPAVLLLRRSPLLIVRYSYAPWALAWSWRVLQPLRNILHQLWNAKQMQSLTYDDAWQSLASRISSKLAYRTRRYDVYLPPLSNLKAILFVPGAGVQEVAYASLASRLADQGFLVVVLSAEPLRLATVEFGITSEVCKNIMNDVSREHACAKEWFCMAHSLGSFTLSQFADELGVEKVVFCGVTPMFAPRFLNDLSKTSLELLLLQGSKDGLIAKFKADPKVEELFLSRLPAKTTTKVIEGGTHSGFASYQSSIDETGGIPREKQHEQVVQAVVAFLQ